MKGYYYSWWACLIVSWLAVFIDMPMWLIATIVTVGLIDLGLTINHLWFDQQSSATNKSIHEATINRQVLKIADLERLREQLLENLANSGKARAKIAALTAEVAALKEQHKSAKQALLRTLIEHDLLDTEQCP